MGALTMEQVRQEMGAAIALVLPSIWYENFPRTLVEALGCGLPIIASRIGALAELVKDGETGLLFEPDNTEDLAHKMRWALANPQVMADWGRNARKQYETEFTAEPNYQQLMAIYQGAIEEVKRTPQMVQSERKTFAVIRVPIDAVSFDTAQSRVMAWGHARESRYVVLANVHVVVTASRESSFGAVVAGADMATPDGAPVAWMVGKLGHKAQERVSGPDLTWALLGRCEREALPVYFFGSTPETLTLLATRICASFPKLQAVGYESPPFRPLTAQEDAECITRINTSGAGLVFVGLGCPKQEQWMQAHRGKVNAVMLGVGAAFDFHAGTISRAPVWMGSHGLEWLHRLASEPKRLWKRYLVTNTLFVLGAIRQLVMRHAER